MLDMQWPLEKESKSFILDLQNDGQIVLYILWYGPSAFSDGRELTVLVAPFWLPVPWFK